MSTERSGGTSAPGLARKEVGNDTVLSVRGLCTSFPDGRDRGRQLRIVDDVSFDVGRGRTLGIIGESGSGKSMTAYSILGLVPAPGRVESGEVWLGQTDLTTAKPRVMASIRGQKIGMILQDPMASLHPMYRVGDQVREPLLIHEKGSRNAAWQRAVKMLEAVRIPGPDRRAREYPHQMSGGMKQRIVSATAIACSPEVVIADEPTTALDVTTQIQFLSLLQDLQREQQFGMIFISHDLGVIARIADNIAVMYAGRIVEIGPARDVLLSAQHPYTQALLRSTLPMDQALQELPTIEGQPPAPASWPAGCRFEPRCELAFEACDVYPPVTGVSTNHHVACWLHAND